MAGCMGGCSDPYCEICKPKLVSCEDCGHKVPMIFDKCPNCGGRITEKMRLRAKRDWYIVNNHPDKAEEMAELLEDIDEEIANDDDD